MTADRESVPGRQQAVWLGELIRIRRRGRYSLEALARRSGISSGLLSEIERGKGNPSYFTLLKLAEALDMEPSEFFPVTSATGHDPVVRAENRQRVSYPDGRYTEFLSPQLDLPTVMWKAVYPPGADYRDSPFTIIAETALVVVKGRILARIQGRDDICLEEDDAIRLEAGVRYGGYNPGEGIAALIGASAGPPFSISHLSEVPGVWMSAP